MSLKSDTIKLIFLLFDAVVSGLLNRLGTGSNQVLVQFLK